MKAMILRAAGLSALLLALALTARAANPYLPLWEYIPDGEPYVFEDPDHPGQYRVYIYGSHDTMQSEYCGRDQVVWSAAVEDLRHWRFDGVIFTSRTNAKGELLRPNGLGDVLYAPDVVEKIGADGRKTYYLYPNNQAGGRQGMVARSDRPDGPFEVCNWDAKNPARTDGVLRFDPGVFIDDDGRVYGFWGFKESFAAELDPATMATLRPGTEVVRPLPASEGFQFFEASSPRKIGDKYILVYSRVTPDGEFGLPSSNYNLAYAYSDAPLGPYVYGGTIIDARARGVDWGGNPVATASPNGNTHGGLARIGDQWYIFYHRQAGTTGYARQAMVAPVQISVSPGPGGKVEITEAEYTSEGFELGGLDPLEWHSAGIACYYTGPQLSVKDRGGNIFYGSYIAPMYGVWQPGIGVYEQTLDRYASVEDAYDLSVNSNPVVNNTPGSVVGYKYFNFDGIRAARAYRLLVKMVPQGVRGRIVVMADSPWKDRGGRRLGVIRLSGREPQELTTVRARVRPVRRLQGKHAIYFVFEGSSAVMPDPIGHPDPQGTPGPAGDDAPGVMPNPSLCELHAFTFARR